MYFGRVNSKSCRVYSFTTTRQRICKRDSNSALHSGQVPSATEENAVQPFGEGHFEVRG